MLPQAVPGPKLGFGPFQYDPSVRELWKHSSRLRLPSQPREVLEALLERPGELVTREDLRNRLWPGATAGDFEHGLNAAVNKLRQALGDSADQPRYVETIPGRGGYRFAAPVRFASANAPVREMPAPLALRIEPNRPAPGRWLRLAVAGALVMTAISGGIYWYTLRPQLPAARVVRFSVHLPRDLLWKAVPAGRQSRFLRTGRNWLLRRWTRAGRSACSFGISSRSSRTGSPVRRARTRCSGRRMDEPYISWPREDSGAQTMEGGAQSCSPSRRRL